MLVSGGTDEMDDGEALLDTYGHVMPTESRGPADALAAQSTTPRSPIMHLEPDGEE